MSQAIADPDELDAFAHRLQSYLDQVNEATGQLNQAFGALGETWQDAQRAQFEEQFQELTRQIDVFGANAADQIPHLRGLAAKLREYLQS
jgi:uncharacterized protein YukE